MRKRDLTPKTLSVRFTESTYDRIDDVARNEGVSLADVVRRAVLNDLRLQSQAK